MIPSLQQPKRLGTVDQLPEHFRLRAFAEDYVEALTLKRQPRETPRTVYDVADVAFGAVVCTRTTLHSAHLRLTTLDRRYGAGLYRITSREVAS